MPVDTSDEKTQKNLQLAEDIFAEHGNFIETIINSRVRDEHLRNDFYNDFFLFLVRKPLSDGIENIRAYLYRTVCNQVNSALRKHERYRTHLYQHNLEALRRDEHPLPESSIAAVDDLKKIIKLIESNLSSTQSDVIKLKHRDGLTDVEIAEKLNLTQGTVSAYYSMAKKKIRKILRKSEERQ